MEYRQSYIVQTLDNLFGVLGGFYYMVFTIVSFALSRYIEFMKDYQLIKKFYSTESESISEKVNKYLLH